MYNSSYHTCVMVAIFSFSFNFCPNCYDDKDIIIDHTVGAIICSECGCLLDSNSNSDNITDDSSSSVESRDQCEDPVLETAMDDEFEADKTSVRKPKRGFKLLEAMADDLGLGTGIKEKACEIYNIVDVRKTCRGRSMNSVVAACMFIACREFKLSRTLNEISSVANGVARKDINRAIESIKKQLEVETGTVQAGELVRRFCSKLGMEYQAIKAAHEAVQKAEELDIRRSPKSVLAAIIYMVIQLSDNQVPVKDIAISTEVTELTIRKSFKDISPFASKIIPNWYAEEENIKKIPIP